jgi:hypothetical protein
MSYNSELDNLLCLLDGKISAYRLKYGDSILMVSDDLILIQNAIQYLWDRNDKEKKKDGDCINASC